VIPRQTTTPSEVGEAAAPEADDPPRQHRDTGVSCRSQPRAAGHPEAFGAGFKEHTMSIYRSHRGRQRITAWASDRLDAWPVPHSTDVIETSLGPTHVVAAGDGPPVLVVPGTNFCAAVDLEVLEPLTRIATIHAIDLPGQPGLSADVRPRGRHPYGPWVREVVRALGLRRPLLVGTSFGAHVVLQGSMLRGQEPDEVRGMVLVSPAGPIRLRVPLPVLRRTFAWLRWADLATSRQLLATMQAPGGPERFETLAAWFVLVGTHVRTSLAPKPLPRRQLAALSGTPTLVVSGREDRFIPPRPLIRAVKRKLPEGEVRIVPNAGHLLAHEHPEAVAAAVGSQLTATLDRRGGNQT